MDDSASWKTEETIIRLATVTCILQIWWLSPSPSRRIESRAGVGGRKNRWPLFLGTRVWRLNADGKIGVGRSLIHDQSLERGWDDPCQKQPMKQPCLSCTVQKSKAAPGMCSSGTI